ncbi:MULTISPECIES: hypothetical protein [unclassified Francisella]|uniref:hypothetical protein n=1 Tax=unclassified Francisella TaxID=2610885 RepID=UPI002E2F2BA5|nr:MULTISPECIES: hypothetical protein [unclassified Francisella]MED7818474.1 hypothetical protein [Francisella sp. 19S2-4]MED7829271.1 hypothetical protein [Francisella sp. 19S2-10]
MKKIIIITSILLSSSTFALSQTDLSKSILKDKAKYKLLQISVFQNILAKNSIQGICTQQGKIKDLDIIHSQQPKEKDNQIIWQDQWVYTDACNKKEQTTVNYNEDIKTNKVTFSFLQKGSAVPQGAIFEGSYAKKTLKYDTLKQIAPVLSVQGCNIKDISNIKPYITSTVTQAKVVPWGSKDSEKLVNVPTWNEAWKISFLKKIIL